ncbi:MAG: class I SAM-dependent methyltransferase [Hahellaceae bacterium]|nr:class I SAM-dependent methyltransferase [Hahellaceae bacterium]MCP5170070.1 class I SAM-dependent methyltransferase [Hahellaceae bacterium]
MMEKSAQPIPQVNESGSTTPSDEAQRAYTGVRTDIVEMIPPSVQKVLDVGCSNGTLGGYLKTLSATRQVYGAEAVADFCSTARRHLDRVEQVDLNQQLIGAVYPGECFDCVVFGDVLEHLVSPEKQLQSVREVLAPDAYVVVSMPNIRHLSAFVSIFLKGHFPRRERGLFDKTHLRWYTLSDAIRLLEACGFVKESVTYSLRIGDRGDGFLNKVLRKLFGRVAHWFIFREFFCYQYCIRARMVPVEVP